MRTLKSLVKQTMRTLDSLVKVTAILDLQVEVTAVTVILNILFRFSTLGIEDPLKMVTSHIHMHRIKNYYYIHVAVDLIWSDLFEA